MMCIDFVYGNRFFKAIWGFPVAQLKKNPPAMWETWVWSLGWEDPLEEGKTTHSTSGLEYSMDCSPWDHKEWDTTERLSLSFF